MKSRLILGAVVDKASRDCYKKKIIVYKNHLLPAYRKPFKKIYQYLIFNGKCTNVSSAMKMSKKMSENQKDPIRRKIKKINLEISKEMLTFEELYRKPLEGCPDYNAMLLEYAKQQFCQKFPNQAKKMRGLIQNKAKSNLNTILSDVQTSKQSSDQQEQHYPFVISEKLQIKDPRFNPIKINMTNGYENQEEFDEDVTNMDHQTDQKENQEQESLQDHKQRNERSQQNYTEAFSNTEIPKNMNKSEMLLFQMYNNLKPHQKHNIYQRYQRQYNNFLKTNQTFCQLLIKQKIFRIDPILFYQPIDTIFLVARINKKLQKIDQQAQWQQIFYSDPDIRQKCRQMFLKHVKIRKSELEYICRKVNIDEATVLEAYRYQDLNNLARLECLNKDDLII